MTKIAIDGVLRDMTAKEEADNKIFQDKEAISIQQDKEIKAARQLNKASAEQKLRDLGLTDAEISAFRGGS